MFKNFLLLVIIILSFSSIFSYQYEVKHTQAEGVEFWYCDKTPKKYSNNPIDTCYNKNFNELGPKIDSKTGNSPFILIHEDSEKYWKGLYLFKKNKRLVFTGRYTWENWYGSNFDDFSSVYFTSYLTPQARDSSHSVYNQNFNNKDLQGNICKNDFTFNDNKITISTSLNPITKISSNDRYAIPEHLLEEYYYMKAEIKVDLYFSDEDDPENENYATTIDLNENSNFVLVKPNRNVFNLNLPNKNSLGLDLDEGTPYWKITVTPIDLKCDFNNDGNLENNSKILENNEIEIISKNFQIKNNKNICQPTLTTDTNNNEIFEVKINNLEENQKINSIISFKVLKKKLKGNSFYKKPVIEEEKSIKLSKNEEEINLTKDFDFDINNLGFGEYKYEILVKANDDYCHKNSKTGFSSDEFSSKNKIRKMISDDLIKKSFLKDKEHFGKKIGVSVNGKNLYFDNRPLTFSNITSNISIKQNGITKNESVEIRDIALISHKIKKLKNFEESQQLISNIENTFKNKKIYKNISSNNSQTKVDISVPNLQDDEKILVYFDKSAISRSQAPAWERVV